MSLDASDLLNHDWPVVSALLDELLALPEHERETFVASLSGERARHREVLSKLLAPSSGVETGAFLATLPKLTPLPGAAELNEMAEGDIVGSYQLLSELGTGGMGAVWLAQRADGAFQRKVAVKLPRLSWARGLVERVARERDILASLEHPHIARLYDAGVDQYGRPYLALEYVDGKSIDVYARERGLSIEDKLSLLLQVAAAVAFAHSRLVVHRDLKPSNILVTADGQVRLLDFGIAKLMEGDRAAESELTQMAGRALTLDYASPEQIKGEPIGTASDVYSLGVVAYELLTGAKPYKLKRGSAAELEEAIATADVPLASNAASDVTAKKALRGDLDAILNKALKKVPAERYLTVDALAQDLHRHLRNEPVSAQPESLGYRSGKFFRRYRVQVIAGGVVVAAVLAGTAVAVWQAGEAEQAAQQARAAQKDALAQAANAQQQARRAEAVKQFLIELFSSNDVNVRSAEQRRALSTEQLLQEGAQRVNAGFKDQPELRAELQGVVGRLLYDLRLLEHAATALQERAEYLDRIQASPAERATAWLGLARLRSSQSDEAGFYDALNRAMATGDRAQTPQDWTAHWAAVAEYATSLDVRGKTEEALRRMKPAVEGLRSVAPQSAEYALTLESYASMFIDMGNETEALPMLAQALKLFEVLYREQPVELARVYIRYGYNLLGLDDVEAERLTRSGLQTMRQYVGPDHPSTARGVLRLAHLLIRRGESQEARALIAPLISTIETSAQPFPKNISGQAYRLIGEASLDEGRLEEASQWSAKFAADAQNDNDRAQSLQLAARLNAEIGDYAAADADLQRARAYLVADTAPDHPVFAVLQVRQAELLWHRGQTDAARTLLIAVVGREGKIALQSTVNAARITLARIALASGQPAAALDWLGPNREQLARLPADLQGRVRTVATLAPLASALIGVGRVSEAKPLVAQTTSLVETLYANGPLRLQVQVLAARLAIAEGRLDDARAQVQTARALIGRERRVASHHMRALENVERAIARPASG